VERSNYVAFLKVFPDPRPAPFRSAVFGLGKTSRPLILEPVLHPFEI